MGAGVVARRHAGEGDGWRGGVRMRGMHHVGGADFELDRREVILGGRVGLHNVPALAPDVEVVNLGSRADLGRARLHGEGVRAVLEGAAVLVGVDGQLEERGFPARVREEAWLRIYRGEGG